MQTALNLNIDEATLTATTLQKMWETFNTPVGNDAGVALVALRRAGIKMNRQNFDAEFRSVIAKSFASLNTQLPKLNEEFLQGISKSKVLCLSEAPDLGPMWTHYADQHRGVVLEFGTPLNVDSPWKTAKPINYLDEAPNLYDEDLLSDMLSGKMLSDTEATMEIINRYVFTKGKAWAYERERRIYTGDGRYPDADFEDVKFHELELFSVIFGCHTEHARKGHIEDLAIGLNPNVSIFQAERKGLGLAMIKIKQALIRSLIGFP